ncbi:NAD-dependent epimerase/dehydratase family protein [Metabacillus sp. JX24]|uniref:NAD-dependent epimerase/dehydratase family protein n=1 Tax=Metabacillus sp. JX24 TaxID=3240759 RepID=UPI003510BBA5
MNILILGGTRFLGRAFTEEALNRGYRVTLLNRGTNKGLFPGLEQLTGDRNGDMTALGNRKWDAVIDTSGFAPHHIRKASEFLGDIGHYTFISSISVYRDWIPAGIQEDYPLQTISDERLAESEKGTLSPYEHYGALKALSEEEAEKHWPGRVLNVRAGQLVGPFDYSDRLPYWVQRVSQGGQVIVPGRPDRPVQMIDVRDLAVWVFNMILQGRGGTYNATGQKETMEDILQTCKSVSSTTTKFVWTDEAFLLENKIKPWTDMPLWIPERFPLGGEKEPWKGTFEISIEKAVEAGLTFRSLTETIRDVYDWEKSREPSDLKAGISREKEQELLQKQKLKL